MDFVKRTSIDNLILKVDKMYDPAKLNLDVWEDYLNCLCVGRTYQKEAIKNTIIYLVSGKYTSLTQLAQESYNANNKLQDKYGSFTKMQKTLQMPNIPAATIDLATGTGKSYVIFGIANILMCIGYCDRVLVLCPSTTIESGLIEKFTELHAREDLKYLMPNTCATTDLRLVDANQTISNGDICIENIHAVYANTGSSIKDSFSMSGSNTLILSDEVHHCYNAIGNTIETKSLKKWKEFVLDEQYKFKAHIGFTGTAYINDEYCTDVIYRYSLKQAVDDKVVKKVKYVDEDITDNDDEKFQKIYINHEKIKQEIALTNLKPLSIIITADIKKANGLREDFLDFLEKYTKLDRIILENKVIVVTSSTEHKTNILKLKEVDNDFFPVEWIISVSMLTEGWDVKNVFQIVPWDDRAFNSKLLIAQVLGRGLRIPIAFGSIQPEVRVMNHASWSKNIRKIVDEILEKEETLTSKIVDTTTDRSKYNFVVHNLNYEQIEREEFNENYDKTETFDIRKPLTLITQSTTITRNTTFIGTNDETPEKRIYEIHRETLTVDEIVDNIIRRFQSRHNEAKKRNLTEELVFEDGQTELEKLPTADEIKHWILRQMASANIKGDRLTAENIKKINGKFTGMLRKKRSSAGFVRKVKDIQIISTTTMNKAESRFSMLNNGGTIFYPSDFETKFEENEKEMLNSFLNELPKKSGNEKNVFLFKTPLNIVVVNKIPEKQFVELLFDCDFAQKITAWVKSRDVGFYSIQYILQRGTEQQSFNPDFFIKIGSNIAVIETKSDNDICKENFSKMIDTRKHFENLNKQLEEESSPIRYKFNMISPCSYSDFKKTILDNTYFSDGFTSKLEADLEEKIKNKE